MLIDLIIKVEPTQEGGGDCSLDIPFYISQNVDAKLIFRLPTATVTFWNYGKSPAEAFMNTINSFLANIDFQIADHYNIRNEYRAGIQFADHIAPELKNIIENAIDLKTGGDRNKLTETIYREQQ